MNLLQNLFDESPSPMDNMGHSFIQDPTSISNEQAFQLLSDLLNTDEELVAQFLNGRKFTPDRKKVENEV